MLGVFGKVGVTEKGCDKISARCSGGQCDSRMGKIGQYILVSYAVGGRSEFGGCDEFVYGGDGVVLCGSEVVGFGEMVWGM